MKDVIIRMQVDILQSVNPNIYDILKKLPARMRAEKIRQLSVIGALVESGNLNITAKNENDEDNFFVEPTVKSSENNLERSIYHDDFNYEPTSK